MNLESELRLTKVAGPQTVTEPNQALEPTTLSVTFRAPSRTDRAS